MNAKIEEYGRLVNSKVLEGQMEVLHEVIGMLETEIQITSIEDGDLTSITTVHNYHNGMDKAKWVLEQKAREIGTEYIGCLKKELNPSE
ncbi:hypothetical protein [uncultured Mediterranean phage uvDeep-CGR0-AD1-C239]|nr:hypothetical protein [uncultured Mediterranean phage uvDeep-CGR0-AD1-C239]